MTVTRSNVCSGCTSHGPLTKRPRQRGPQSSGTMRSCRRICCCSTMKRTIPAQCRQCRANGKVCSTEEAIRPPQPGASWRREASALPTSISLTNVGVHPSSCLSADTSATHSNLCKSMPSQQTTGPHALGGDQRYSSWCKERCFLTFGPLVVPNSSTIENFRFDARANYCPLIDLNAFSRWSIVLLSLPAHSFGSPPLHNINVVPFLHPPQHHTRDPAR